jgi:integrase/recombinase XerC
MAKKTYTTSIKGFSAAADLVAVRHDWHGWLARERRVSPHTVAAYGLDLEAFFDFIARHRGAAVSLATLSALSLADFRAWLSALAEKGLSSSSRARAVAAIRSLFRFMP